MGAVLQKTNKKMFGGFLERIVEKRTPRGVAVQNFTLGL